MRHLRQASAAAATSQEASEKKAIANVADVITRARTGIEYDTRGNVDDVHMAEAPTRFPKELVQPMRGALAIGMTREDALALVLRVACDSMPPIRLAVLRYVDKNPGVAVGAVRKALHKPYNSVNRALLGLHYLGLLHCEEKEVERGGRTEVKRSFTIAGNIDMEPIRARPPRVQEESE